MVSKIGVFHRPAFIKSHLVKWAFLLQQFLCQIAIILTLFTYAVIFLRADPHSIFFTYQRQLLFTGNYVNGAWYLRPIFAIA